MTWQRHHGGDNPYAGLDDLGNPLPQPVVEVVFRNRSVCKQPMAADKWRWRWSVPFPRDWDFDIVAHRRAEG